MSRSRYIDADELMKWLYDRYDWETYSVEEFTNVVKGQPTADVVEVVRCKDCKHHGYESNKYPYCGRIEYGYGWRDNDYCSRGERRENDEMG